MKKTINMILEGLWAFTLGAYLGWKEVTFESFEYWAVLAVAVLLVRLSHKVRLKQITKNRDDLEWKLSLILDNVTAGRISKPYTNMDSICKAIEQQRMKEWDYAVEDYRETQELSK